MRFVALALFLLAIPVISSLHRKGPFERQMIWALLGFLPFVTEAWHLDASIISWALWPGHAKGLLMALLDSVAIGSLMALPPQRVKTPFTILIIAYIAAATLSIVFAQVKLASFFFAWELARMLLLFIAVSRIATQPRGTDFIIYGLAAAMILQAVVAINQRLHGVAQTSGLMEHQNSLGMAMHFGMFPCIALLLAGRRDRLILLGAISGMICVVLTGSRATIGLAGSGMVILAILSLMRRPTGRKAGIVAAGALALLVAAPVAYVGLTQRVTTDSFSGSDSERTALIRAAWMIIGDHPMGIGANEYVITANVDGYSARAGVEWGGGSRAAHVHNAYLLNTAELGYLGGGVFIALMVIPVFTVFRFAWSRRTDTRGELALGLAVGLAMAAAHGLFEWIYVSQPILYLHAIGLGLAAGLIRQRRLEARQGRVAPPARRLVEVTA